MMTLPMTVYYHPDETPLSLTSRLAAANGYRSLQEFLRYTNADARSISNGEAEAMAELSRWSGVEPARLLQNAVSGTSAGGSWRLGKALMSKDMRPGRTIRFCAGCIEQDILCGADRMIARPYVRASWMTRALSFCPLHRLRITEVEADPNMAGDLTRFVANQLHSVEAAAAPPSDAGSVKMDEYMLARIHGHLTNDFLDGLEAYVAFDLCRYLGRFAKQHEISGFDLAERDIEVGYWWASKGQSGIQEMIAQAVDTVRPIARDMNTFFGELRKWLKRNLEKVEHRPIVELSQEIVERAIPIGLDDLFLLPTRKRHLHSVRSASIEFGIMEERVVDLVSQAGLLEPSSSRSSSQIYFDCDKAYPILREACDALTTGEMSKLMGTTVERMLKIVNADLLPRVEHSDESGRSFARVSRSDFDAFKKKLEGRHAASEELEGRHSIFRATRVCSCRIEEIIKLALEGKLSLLRFGGQELGRLWIDTRELRVQLGRERGQASDITNLDLLNVRQAERCLKLASGSVAELIKRGLIETQFAENPETRKWQAYVKASSVNDFAGKHLSINQLSERTGIFPTKLRKSLEKQGVHPIFVPKGRVSCFYRRSDIKQLSHPLPV